MAAISSATATLFLRRAGTLQPQQLLFGLPMAWCLTFFALTVYGLGFLAYAQALKRVPANFAYPVMTAITLLLTLSVGWFWLGESFGPRVAAGALLLLVGIYLIGAR